MNKWYCFESQKWKTLCQKYADRLTAHFKQNEILSFEILCSNSEHCKKSGLLNGFLFLTILKASFVNKTAKTKIFLA